MSSSVVATTCPHCRKTIKMPAEYLGKTLRCKGCTKTFTAKALTAKTMTGEKDDTTSSEKSTKATSPKAPFPVKEKSPLPPAVPKAEPYVKRMARQQRSSTVLFAIIVLIAVMAIGGGLFYFKDQLFGVIDQARKPASPTKMEQPVNLLPTTPEVVDDRAGDLTKIQPPEQEKKTRRNLARIPAPYPGRALLVGVRNYLFLNPINPGYRAERSFQRDPLGILTLRRTFTTELSFPRDQVLVLSDVDDQSPAVPTKATIEATIEDFLSSSRPQDRIVLTLAMHAAVLGGKGYLLPIDGELPPEGAKADAERDGKLARNLIPLSWLYQKLADCKARQKLLILDIAQHDPQAGIFRNSPGPLDEVLFQEIKSTPKGVQVWLPCGPKQYSYGLSSSGQYGSTFLDSLCQLSTLSIEKNWKLIENDPGVKAGTLPLVLLAKHVQFETSKYLKEHGYEQSPVLLGEEAANNTPSATSPPSALQLKVVKPTSETISGMDIAAVLKELNIENDHVRNLSPSSFPPLSKSAFTKYQPDYTTAKEMEDKALLSPLRAITLKAQKALNRSLKTFRMRFGEEADEASFKKKIEKEQESPAYVTAELSDLLDDMKKLDEKKEDEPSLRWRAHFDYTQARLLAQLAHVQEYSFVLGNKLRKDTPKIKDPQHHNGWMIVPQRKLEQKETRTYDSERQKILTRIIKEHTGTPWEILARREQATILGLTLQETFLEEGKPLPKTATRQ